MSALDVLDALGLPITEVGAVQLALESARLYWPGGEVRAAVLLQAAWSGELQVELTLSGEGRSTSRTVKVPPGEVRRVRLPLELPGGAAPLSLAIRAPIPEGRERIRAAWLKDAPPPAETENLGAALLGALKHALGKREKRVELRAPESTTVAVALQAVGAPAPLAAEEETVWSPGMPAPAAAGLQSLEPEPAASLVSRTDSRSARPECPSCYTRADLELIKSQRHCPSCGASWLL